ncbi:MAG TPA: hypothetical protein VEA44_16170 [Caulobacter sp.]|nr:hypothetical protein [Caulobacter sp.]
MTRAAPVIADPERLLAVLVRNDPEEIAAAYRRALAGEDGQLVLIHHLARSQVAKVQGAGVSDADRHYFAGMMDGALMLLTQAGFDPAAAQMAVAASSLRGLKNHGTEPRRRARKSRAPKLPGGSAVGSPEQPF